MELTSRFTLYDLLSMVFPGCFIIWSVVSFKTIYQFIHIPKFMTDFYCYVAFFAVAYIIGLGWNEIMRNIWRLFEKTFKESCIKSIVEKRSAKFLEYYNSLHGDNNVRKYNCAYSEIRDKDHDGTIAVVRGQISMLRNMALPLAFWIATLIYDKEKDNICYCVLIGGVVFILILCIAILRQRREYDIVLTKHRYMKKGIVQK